MGLGVSGGEEGARYGPSLMPGGSKEAWELMKPILVQIAAKIDPQGAIPQLGAETFTDAELENACVTHVGPGGAGNYVKMVHNGIEYGDMQLIAEVSSQEPWSLPEEHVCVCFDTPGTLLRQASKEQELQSNL